MRYLFVFFTLAVILLISACTSNSVTPTVADQLTEQDLRFVAEKEAEAERRIAEHEAKILNHPGYLEAAGKNASPTVYLQAGSVDGLQAAIDQAGPYGKVVVKPGLHIENQTVTISHPVRIIGQGTAIIQSNVAPTGALTSLPATVTPSLYVDGAGYVQIRKLTFVPDPTRGFGELAIGTNNADYVYIRDNDFQNFTCAVLARKSEYALVLRNQAEGVLSDGLSQSFILDVASAGFIHASGAHATYVKNTTSDFIHGMFLCDADGLMCQNVGNSSFTSLTLCKWPKMYTLFPDGDSAGADISATNWLVISNKADQSISNGYQVFDGSNNNLLVSNEATNSGDYDVYFAPEVAPGPLGVVPVLPVVFDNTYIGGRFPGQSVKDCGLNNTITGANLVDPAVDPCP
jgi:hypothetical protein